MESAWRTRMRIASPRIPAPETNAGEPRLWELIAILQEDWHALSFFAHVAEKPDRLQTLRQLGVERVLDSCISIVAEGIEYAQGAKIMIGYATDALAGNVIGLLSDSDRRFAVGQVGRRLAEAKHSWDCSADVMNKLSANSSPVSLPERRKDEVEIVLLSSF